MLRKSTRLRIDDDGCLEVIDPGFDSLPLLRSVNPDFRILRAPLPVVASPRFLRAREIGCRMSALQLRTECLDSLWSTHGEIRDQEKRITRSATTRDLGEASLLDLKVELARRALSCCQLCAHRCGVDRNRGEVGFCKLGTEVTVAEHFVHIAEEPPINPSVVLNLAGCGLRCRFCQQFAFLEPNDVIGERLAGALWDKLDTRGARSLSFVGGNPDESLYAILQFLCDAPLSWKLPLVWNCHGYAALETIDLLEGVVDVFVPDFKYGSEACGRRLSGVANYPETAKANIATMVAQGVPVIVRILVLPEHFDCCHAPTLEFLASLPEQKNLFVSVRGQYCPDWKISSQDGELGRRVVVDEVDSVTRCARDLELQQID